jgi:hypothetical protein
VVFVTELLDSDCFLQKICKVVFFEALTSNMVVFCNQLGEMKSQAKAFMFQAELVVVIPFLYVVASFGGF